MKRSAYLFFKGFGIDLRSIWDRFGTMLGSFLEHKWNKHGTETERTEQRRNKN